MRAPSPTGIRSRTGRPRRRVIIMDQRDIARQTLLEQQLLTNITQAIRTTIAWEPRSDGQAGKLRSIRFITASLERHMDHLMDLEEYDGYMSAALECSPNLAEKITALKHEHDQFRDQVHRLVAKLERISADDRTTLER